MKRRNNICLIVTIAFLLCSINDGLTQDTLNKNTIYVSVGSFSFLGTSTLTTTGYYERMIKQNMWDKNISSFVKVGYGKITNNGTGFLFGGKIHNESQYLLAQYGLLVGGKRKHLELGLGMINFINGYHKEEGFQPSVTVGYRFQAPSEKFIFRIGGSYPEAFYLSMGFSF